MSPRRFLAAALLAAAAGCGRVLASTDAPAEAVQVEYLANLDTLAATVGALEQLASGNADTPALQHAFARARRAYKQVEYLLEYFHPTTADGINGPALDDMLEDDPNQTVIPPEGFQVVEELLYPAFDPSSRDELVTEVRILLANVKRVRHGAAATPLTAAAVFDAARLQMLRLVSLGITGFDSPVALRSLPEGAETLGALRAGISPFMPRLRWEAPVIADSIEARLARAEARLRATEDFDGFDRLTFLVEDANPLTASLLEAQGALDIPLPEARRAWRPQVATAFDAGAFDPLFFAPGARTTADSDAMIALGRALFFDAALSRKGIRSCASCHQPDRAFTDGLVRSLPQRRGTVRRNAPTVLNAALQNATFHDMRTTFLEDQVADVIRNPDEMHGSLEKAADAVLAGPGYGERVRAAFGGGALRQTSADQVRIALAAYLRSLEALDSRFDRHVRGDRAALAPAEQRGFNLFMGRAKCGTCHFAPLFNGSVPPAYAKTESEVLGVPERAATWNAPVSVDPGRVAVTRLPIHRHSFRTPTVRNAALTAPYMHNGVFRTLEEVVDFYDAGGGTGIGIDLPNQTLPPDSLRLSAREKSDLVAFVLSLTDTTSWARSRAP